MKYPFVEPVVCSANLNPLLLMSTLDEQLNAPISISDAVSMFKRQLGRNVAPYTLAISKLNNEIVDEWYSTVLVKIADKSGKVPAGRISPSIQTFLEGKEIWAMRRLRSSAALLPPLQEPDNEATVRWIEFLKASDVATIQNTLGVGGVNTVWNNCISHAIRSHFVEKKWECVYSKSEDPFEWETESLKHGQLMHGRPFPFGLDDDTFRDIVDKVTTILRTRIEISQ